MWRCPFVDPLGMVNHELTVPGYCGSVTPLFWAYKEGVSCESALSAHFPLKEDKQDSGQAKARPGLKGKRWWQMLIHAQNIFLRRLLIAAGIAWEFYGLSPVRPQRRVPGLQIMNPVFQKEKAFLDIVNLRVTSLPISNVKIWDSSLLERKGRKRISESCFLVRGGKVTEQRHSFREERIGYVIS